MPAAEPSIERLKQSRVQAVVTFTPEEAAAAEEQALRQLGSEVHIKGFRPGKAPAQMIREKVGAEDLFEATVRVLLRDTLPALLTQHTLAPVIPPKVEAVTRDPLTLRITFVEKPEATVKKIDALAPAKKEIPVDPKDVERTAEGLRRQHRRTEPVDRAAQEGDEVTIDFHAHDEAGNGIQGLSGSDEAVEIGSKTFLPGFEDALIGTKNGEEKEFTLTLPDKFPLEALRGKKAVFHATVKNVAAVALPELTDALVQKLYGVQTVAELRTRIEESIRGQEEQMQRMEREKQLLENLRAQTQVDLADELIEAELGDLIREWSDRLEQQGTTIAAVLGKQGKKPEDAEKELREQAVGRWKLRLGLQKVIEEKQIAVTAEELEHAFQAFLQQMPEERRADATAEWQARGTLYAEIRWRTLVEKTIDMLLA